MTNNVDIYEQPVRPPTSTREAWKSHSDADNTDAACIADKSFQAAKDYFDRKYVSALLSGIFNPQSNIKAEISKLKTNSFKEGWTSLNADEQRALPNSARTAYTRIMPNSAEGNKITAEIIGSHSTINVGGHGFSAWDSEKTAELMVRIGNDPHIKQAQENWSQYSIEQKLKVTERLQAIQADVYGYKPVTISTFDKPPKITKDGAVFISNGAYRSGQKLLEINTNDDKENPPSIHKSFEEFLQTSIHENTHAFQDQLVDRFNTIAKTERAVLEDLGEKSSHDLGPEGKEIYEQEVKRRLAETYPAEGTVWDKGLREGGALVSGAEAFRSRYLRSDDAGSSHEIYQTNPEETHADHVADAVEAYMRTPHDERQNYMSLYKGIADVNKTLDQFRVAEREQHLKSPKFCPAN